METVIAVAAVILVIIQGHRNYLMMKKVTTIQPVVTVNVPEPVVTVNPVIEINVPEQPIPIVNVQPTVVQPSITPVPQYPSGPYWQTPIVSGETENTNEYDDGHTFTINTEEINGFPVRRFPAR